MSLRLSQKTKKQKEPPTNQANKGLQDFGRYSGMAFQMIAIILIMTWCGIKLDKLFDLKPVFTVIFSLVGVFGGIYISLKDFIHK
jgi:F0F1-type ATP synthase assembly protein I